MATLDEARAAKEQLRKAVSGLGGVVGVGVAPEFTTPLGHGRVLEYPARSMVIAEVSEPGRSRGRHTSRVEVLADEVSVDQVAGDADGWVLQVNVTDPSVVAEVPEEIDDVAVRVRVVGKVRAG
ncbi:hypothetical protein L1785_04705 [Antribacter sp. KLBMP9083]|uniref:Uncharacterized protein n=1 Tax=Antribacter soli TaxID=2910976 RepID=A0AA41QB96_9MICO|nr:hypothetical protein [Antribacter soli]MCF4120274.1 hypothetical protein [Antribacter soli]